MKKVLFERNRDWPRLRMFLRRSRYYIPVLSWLPKYEWKRDFLGDLLAGVVKRKINLIDSRHTGVTLATMLVPQGLSYSDLANVPASYGLFSAIFAPLVYSLLATSRYVATGNMLPAQDSPRNQSYPVNKTRGNTVVVGQNETDISAVANIFISQKMNSEIFLNKISPVK